MGFLLCVTVCNNILISEPESFRKYCWESTERRAVTVDLKGKQRVIGREKGYNARLKGKIRDKSKNTVRVE